MCREGSVLAGTATCPSSLGLTGWALPTPLEGPLGLQISLHEALQTWQGWGCTHQDPGRALLPPSLLLTISVEVTTNQRRMPGRG